MHPSQPTFYDPMTGRYYASISSPIAYPYYASINPTIGFGSSQQAAPPPHSHNHTALNGAYYQNQHVGHHNPVQQQITPITNGASRGHNTQFTNESFYNIGQNILNEKNWNTARQRASQLISLFETNYVQNQFKQTLNAKNYSNIALTLGKLAQKNLIQHDACNHFLSEFIAGFFQHLASDAKPTQAIANFIYGLGLLSQRGTLIQADFSPLIAGLIQHLASDPKPTQAISTFIYGLGLLSQRGTIIQAEFSDLMSKFEENLADATEWKLSVSCLYAGLELLKQSHQLTIERYHEFLKKKHVFVSVKSKQKQDEDGEFIEIEALIKQALEGFNKSITDSPLQAVSLFAQPNSHQEPDGHACPEQKQIIKT